MRAKPLQCYRTAPVSSVNVIIQSVNFDFKLYVSNPTLKLSHPFFCSSSLLKRFTEYKLDMLAP